MSMNTQLVCASVPSNPMSLNACSVKSRRRAFSARSSSMCFVSRSDAAPAAAVSVLMLPRPQALPTARSTSACPIA